MAAVLAPTAAGEQAAMNAGGGRHGGPARRGDGVKVVRTEAPEPALVEDQPAARRP